MKLWAIVPLLLITRLASAGTGKISGTVVDVSGAPVHKGVVVKAWPLDMAIMGMPPQTATDEHGHFVLTVGVGRTPDGRLYGHRWDIYPEDDKDGYPDLSVRFYGGAKPGQVVELTPEHPDATVVLTLGPKAGILINTVTDAATGAPLQACAAFRRVSDPHSNIGPLLKQPEQRVLVPSNTDVEMKVYLVGYKPWYYRSKADKSPRWGMRLRPGQEMNLDIRLRRDKSKPPGCKIELGKFVPPPCPNPCRPIPPWPSDHRNHQPPQS